MTMTDDGHMTAPAMLVATVAAEMARDGSPGEPAAGILRWMEQQRRAGVDGPELELIAATVDLAAAMRHLAETFAPPGMADDLTRWLAMSAVESLDGCSVSAVEAAEVLASRSSDR